MPHQYLWSDIWLLMAILVGDQHEGSDLHEIIAAGDWLNHLIFNDEELESGFARLTEGGLIEERASRFHATALARANYRKASAVRKDFHSIWNSLGERLGAERARPGMPMPDPRNNLAYPGFSAAAVEAARRRYHDEMQQFISGGDTKRDPKKT